MAKKARTDIHRVGAIVPADYAYVISYSLPTVQNGFPVPAVNLDRVLHLRETERFALTGGPGRCSVCGARYLYGDVWVHAPTGEHVHIGHDCAEKYRLLSDRSAFELELDRARALTARQARAELNAKDRVEFLAANPGLSEALEHGTHHILLDLSEKFRRFCSLSEKQVALALKLYAEETNPAPKVEEKHAPAPEGRHTFRGVVVSVKTVENAFGYTTKMTVKVTTPEGVWLAWGTAPASLFAENLELKGRTVEITGTLSRGRDEHFAFFKRPSGRVVSE